MIRKRQRTPATALGSFIVAGMLVGCGSTTSMGSDNVSSAGESLTNESKAAESVYIDSPAKLRAAAEAAGYACGEWAEGGVGDGEVARGACDGIGTWVVYPDHASILAGLKRYREFWQTQGDGTETYVAVGNFLLVAGDSEQNVENVKGLAADLYDTTAESFRRMD